MAFLASLTACGDDADSSQDSLDGGRDGGRDAATLDGKAGDRDASSTITIDAGEAGVIKVERSDGCPADAPLPVNRIRIYPAQGGGANLADTTFQGSNDNATGTGVVQLVAIDAALPDAQWTELTFSNDTVYRWVRLFDPMGRAAKIAEVEFYHDAVKLGGSSYGTVSAGSNDHPYGLAFDGDLSTYYSGMTSGGNYIGLDFGGSYVAAAPTFTPAEGALPGPSAISLASTTPGAAIRYLTDGSDPTPATGLVYTQPLQLDSGTLTIRALTTAPCYFASDVARARYGIGQAPIVEGQRTYHIGNSLTDTFEDSLPLVADSSGVEHEFARSTIPGAPIGWLWEHRAEAGGKPESAGNIPAFAQSYAPIDQMTLQPFSDPQLSTQVPAAVNFYNLVLQYSPNVKLWLYAQWPSNAATGPQGGTFGYTEDPFARGGGDWAGSPTPVPNTWEDTTDAQLSYHEEFARRVEQAIPGRQVLICPAGSALAELKRRVDKGMVPGQTDFFAANFQPDSNNPAQLDELHLSNAGKYAIGLALYACFYRTNPVDKVTYKPDGLSDAQALVYKQVAWEVVSSYPKAGILAN